jgi:hypothetical protein
MHLHTDKRTRKHDCYERQRKKARMRTRERERAEITEEPQQASTRDKYPCQLSASNAAQTKCASNNHDDDDDDDDDHDEETKSTKHSYSDS